MFETYPTKAYAVTHPQFRGHILASISCDTRTKCTIIVTDEAGEPTDHYLDGAEIQNSAGIKIGTIMDRCSIFPCQYNVLPVFKIVKDGLECDLQEQRE